MDTSSTCRICGGPLRSSGNGYWYHIADEGPQAHVAVPGEAQ